MDWASRFAYVFDLGWFLVFTCVPILVVAILILMRGGPWLRLIYPRVRALRQGANTCSYWFRQ